MWNGRDFWVVLVLVTNVVVGAQTKVVSTRGPKESGMVLSGPRSNSGGTGHSRLGLPGRGMDLSGYELRPVYVNDFGKEQKVAHEEDFIERTPEGTWRRKGKPDPGAEWIAEGWGGAEVREGKLRVSPSEFDATGKPKKFERSQRSHMVVWNRNVFPADFLLEFDMSPNGSDNGLTIVLFCATGKNGEDIFADSLPPRRADYKTYHSGAIANYSDSYWSRNNDTESRSNRLRKNPGFKLVAEGPSLTTGPTNVTHHVRVLKFGPHIEIEINGQVTFKWDDADKALGEGRIGLRSMEGASLVTYDNFKVWRLRARKAGGKRGNG